MKEIKVLLVIGIATVLTNCSPKNNNKAIDNQLNQLLEQKDYFKLRKMLENNEDQLSEDKLLYYKAFIAKAFGESEKSINYIDILMDKYKTRFNDSMIVELLDLKAVNSIYGYKYEQASNIYGEILSKYPKLHDSTDVVSFQNLKNIFGTFANVKPQLMHPHNTVEINSYRNNFNHLMAPVKSNGIASDFIFDTGANLSTISESQAKKMNFEIFEQKADVGSSTLIKVQSKLAVADSLYVDDILFENVIFLVIPDEQLTFPEINYKINGVIGFPVIHQLEEVHLHKDGRMTIQSRPKETKLNNMVLEGLNPVVKMESGNDTLLFTFDTGARNSELSFKYYNEHKGEVEKNGKRQTNKSGGVGGITRVEEYMLTNFPIKIGTKSTTLSSIPVKLEEYSFNKYFDGNLGQDVFTQFNTLIINFKYMYIDFE